MRHHSLIKIIPVVVVLFALNACIPVTNSIPELTLSPDEEVAILFLDTTPIEREVIVGALLRNRSFLEDFSLFYQDSADLRNKPDGYNVDYSEALSQHKVLVVDVVATTDSYWTSTGFPGYKGFNAQASVTILLKDFNDSEMNLVGGGTSTRRPSRQVPALVFEVTKSEREGARLDVIANATTTAANGLSKKYNEAKQNSK